MSSTKNGANAPKPGNEDRETKEGKSEADEREPRPEEISLLSIIHDRYNHLTGLRLQTAYRFYYISGATLAFLAYLFQSTKSNTGGNGGGGPDTGTLFLILFAASSVLALMGLSIVKYDAIARKVSCSVALAFLSHFKDKDFYKRQIAMINSKDEESYQHFDEEFYFFLPVLILTSALFAVVVFSFGKLINLLPDSWLPLGIIITVLTIGVFLFLWKHWKEVFINYPVKNWQPSGWRTIEEKNKEKNENPVKPYFEELADRLLRRIPSWPLGKEENNKK